MNILFPEQFNKILERYNIQKEYEKPRSFILHNLSFIPDLIYGINSEKYWFLATGKNGLYQYVDSERKIGSYSLIDITKIIKNHIPYNFIFGNKKEEKYLAPHPISGKVTEWTPKDAFYICKKLNKRIPELEFVIAKDAQYAYWYAEEIIKGRFRLGEQIIATNPEFSYSYANNIIKGRFELGENIISKSPKYSYRYAAHILNSRFPLGESAIATHAELAYSYAKNIIKGRFELGEIVILKDVFYEKFYRKLFLQAKT